MYSNGEGLGTPARTSTKHKTRGNGTDENNQFASSKRFVRCICPRCRKTFTIYMVWTGRGMPRKYCADCKSVINAYDESAMLGSCNSFLAPTKKRSRNSFEEY